MDQTYPEIDKLLATQKTYFESHATYDIEFRKTQLLKLKGTISKYTNEIQSAMFNDLHKSAGESFYAEINFVLSEIDFIVKHLSKWAIDAYKSVDTKRGRKQIRYPLPKLRYGCSRPRYTRDKQQRNGGKYKYQHTCLTVADEDGYRHCKEDT